MSQNMLGRTSVELLRLWKGPLADLINKLLSEGGDEVEKHLNAFLRKESEEQIYRKWPQLRLPEFHLEVEGYMKRAGVSYSRPSLWSHARSLEKMISQSTIDLSRVRLIPPYSQCTSIEHSTDINRSDRQWYSLGLPSFITCWGHRDQLPRSWEVMGSIFFDGFTVIDDGDMDYEFSLVYMNDKWEFEVGNRKIRQRFPHNSCSAVHI